MAIATYDDLRAEIIDTLDRNDLAGNIDSFIALAEARHKRDIRIREMQKRAQTVLSGSRFVGLPSRFLEMRNLRLLTNPVTVLQFVNLDEMNRRRRDGAGKPRFFTLHQEIELDRDPDDAYTLEILYFAHFLPLSGSNQINSLLTIAPDAYLYAALAASAPFINDDERIQTWESGYGNAVTSLTLTDRRARNVGPLISSVTGATP